MAGSTGHSAVTFPHQQLVQNTVKQTTFVPQKTFTQNILAPEVNHHVIHGESTVQTSAHHATPEEMAQLSLMNLGFFDGY